MGSEGPNKVALITGITGQDGSYLCELLLSKGYIVHGVVRRTSSLARGRLDHLFRDDSVYEKKLFLHYSDLEDYTTIRRIIVSVAPAEIYHLAGQSHVGLSFEIPESTCAFTAMGTLGLLEIIRDITPPPKIFHASSSEVFGSPTEAPQSERTPLSPISPYGCAKAFATQIIRVYRDSFSVFGVNGISYNHESPRRGEQFVTQKICIGAAEIRVGIRSELRLGNLTDLRDWGDARDYVYGYWLALQHPTPQDYVFATGIHHSVMDILEIVFSYLDLDWRKFVVFDQRYSRPTNPVGLIGDPTRATLDLNWGGSRPFRQTLEEMTKACLERVS